MAAGGIKKDAPPAGSPAAAVTAAAAASPAEARMENELQELRDLLAAQGKQLHEQNEQLKEELKEQQRKVQFLEGQLNETGGLRRNLTATPAVAAAVASGSGLTGRTAGAATTAAAAAAAGAEAGQAGSEAPASIHIKGITLTPGGYMAAESVWRQRALMADVNSPFNAVPFPGSSQSHASEFNASGRQSRVAMLAEGKLDTVKIGGYYEADFLSAGLTSNSNQSNSYTFRQRQFWAQAAFTNGWTFTGGQMWSLVTETKRGVDNRTEAPPLVIDAQYNVGFSWARQYGFRVAKHMGDKLWLAFAVENPETTLAVHGNNNNFLAGAPGATGGLMNPIATYAFSAAPDLVFKAAIEPGWGHYEIFGVVSTFRARVFPNFAAAVNPTAGAFNDKRAGGGIGANARVALLNKKVEVGLHFLGGDGVGRYGTAGLADVTVRPNGTLAPIRSFQSLGSLELHPTPKLDVYMYVGGEYAARTAYIKSGAVPNEGYGAQGFNNFACYVEPLPGSSVSTPTGVGGSTGFIPGSLGSNCTGDTRNIIEGTFGFWYRFYKGPKGTIQWGPQYSYVQRNTWYGVGSGTVNGVTVTSNGAPHGVENMLFTSFRYSLP